MFSFHWNGRRGEKPRKGRWTEAEIARLRDLYGLRDERTIARELNRSVPSVRRMSETICREIIPRSGPWTADEVQRLKHYLGASTPEVIGRILGRQPEEVDRQIMELGRIRGNDTWTREEVARFKRLYGTRTDEDLSLIFGRSLESVRNMAVGCRLAKDKAFRRKLAGQGATEMPRWAARELGLLRDLYPATSNLEIAQRLGRTVKSVVSKAHHLGLKKTPQRLQAMGRENVGLRYER